MSSFKEFLRWYNGDVVPTLEAMQNMIAFYHNKNFVMLKLSCIVPILTYNCLYRSTDAKYYPFTDGHKAMLQNIREDMVGGPSIVFTRKAIVGKILIR